MTDIEMIRDALMHHNERGAMVALKILEAKVAGTFTFTETKTTEAEPPRTRDDEIATIAYEIFMASVARFTAEESFTRAEEFFDYEEAWRAERKKP